MRAPAWRATALALVVACLAGAIAAAAGIVAPTTSVAPAGRAYLLTRDGKLLQALNADAPLPPASLTKLLTALVVLDARWDPNAWLRVSATAAAAEPSRLDLRIGDEIKAGDALVGMLVHSANDACLLLVEHAAASQAEFLRLMNQRARALGMQASHFGSPCGFDAADQYASANDLLRLGLQAWDHPLIRYIATLREATIRTRAGRNLHFLTTNALLGRLDGVLGLKTGYTARAGECLIAVAERDGHRVWLVMLGADDRWWSAHRLIDAALAGPSEPPR